MNINSLRLSFILKLSIINLLILMVNFDVLAQTDHTIKGNLLDSKFKTPVAFANIKLLKANISSMSNSEGFFAFNYASSSVMDTLLITCIGYKSIKIPLQLSATLDFKDFILTPNMIVLNEVIISSLKLI